MNQRDEILHPASSLLVATTARPVSAAGARPSSPRPTAGHNRVAATLATQFRRDGALPRVVDHFYDLVHPSRPADAELYYAVLRGCRCLAGPTGWVTS